MSAKAKKQKTSKSAKGGNSTAEASSSKPAKPTASKVTLKLGPKPKEPEVFPCCLCVSMSQEKLLRVQDPPLWRKEGESVPGADDKGAVWMAHEECANVVPETWVDEIEVGEVREDGTRAKERVVFGVDGIVKDRWNLVRYACLGSAASSTHVSSLSSHRRNVRLAQRIVIAPTVHQSNARRASVQKHFMSPVHAKGEVLVSFITYFGKWRRRSYFWILKALQRCRTLPTNRLLQLPVMAKVGPWMWTRQHSPRVFPPRTVWTPWAPVCSNLSERLRYRSCVRSITRYVIFPQLHILGSIDGSIATYAGHRRSKEGDETG